MSLFDYVEVTFHGGPHDGTVSLSASEVALNRTPMQSTLAGICSSWRAAHREDAAFTGRVLLLPADRLVKYGQDVPVRYRVDWVDLRDNGTLKLILKYLGTTDAQEPTT